MRDQVAAVVEHPVVHEVVLVLHPARRMHARDVAARFAGHRVGPDARKRLAATPFEIQVAELHERAAIRVVLAESGLPVVDVDAQRPAVLRDVGDGRAGGARFRRGGFRCLDTGAVWCLVGAGDGARFVRRAAAECEASGQQQRYKGSGERALRAFCAGCRRDFRESCFVAVAVAAVAAARFVFRVPAVQARLIESEEPSTHEIPFRLEAPFASPCAVKALV